LDIIPWLVEKKGEGLRSSFRVFCFSSRVPPQRKWMDAPKNIMTKATLEKIFEYASMPVHGTLSRKLRKDIRLQINEEKLYENAVFFLGEEFVRVTENTDDETINTYYDWGKIVSVRTIANITK
jgi:hypothetical protein